MKIGNGPNNAPYFRANDGTNGPEPWTSDGSTMRRIPCRSWISMPPVPAPGLYSYPVFEMDGSFYFAAADGVSGNELRRTAGTPAGTVRSQTSVPARATTWTEPTRAAIGHGLFPGIQFRRSTCGGDSETDAIPIT